MSNYSHHEVQKNPKKICRQREMFILQFVWRIGRRTCLARPILPSITIYTWDYTVLLFIESDVKLIYPNIYVSFVGNLIKSSQKQYFCLHSNHKTDEVEKKNAAVVIIVNCTFLFLNVLGPVAFAESSGISCFLIVILNSFNCHWWLIIKF